MSINSLGTQVLDEKTLFEEYNKVDVAIKRLQTFEPKDGYYLAFSGGKDSIVIKALADMAEVKYDAHYSFIEIDPPEVHRFMREYHSDVKFDRGKASFFKELQWRGYPLRQMRWCCEIIKEKGGTGRLIVTGIRRDESNQRKNRKMVEPCFKDSTKRYLNAIIDWTDEDIWEFIRKYDLPYCELYDQGWKRVGCLFCPMNYHRKTHVEMYPKFVNAFILSFQKYLDYCKRRNLTASKRFKTGEEMFWWWINERKTSKVPDQGVMFE